MATSKSSPSENIADREIVITRVFDAPRDLVWDAWTERKQLVQWWGPRGFTTSIHQMDVRSGGLWQYTMRGPDDTVYPNECLFVEVAKPERIVYSQYGGKVGDPAAQFRATWTFEAQEAKTKVTLRMVFPSAEERELAIKMLNAVEGGNQTLDRLAEQLAQTPPHLT